MTKRTVLAVMLAGALVLAACSNTDGASVQSLRTAAGIPSTAQPVEAPAATATPLPTETLRQAQDAAPDIAPQTFTQPATPEPVIVEVTRETVQQVETTRIVVVTATPLPTSLPTPLPTPDIAGFQDSGIDESVQPCPVKFWNHKRHRCMANDATVEAYAAAYANEVQP